VINQNSLHGRFNQLEVGDRARVQLFDETMMEGRITGIEPMQEGHRSIHTGGVYVSRYWVPWENIRFITILSRPTAEEKFRDEVGDQIAKMAASLTGARVTESFTSVARMVIKMVRDHDAEEQRKANEVQERVIHGGSSEVSSVIAKDSGDYTIDSGERPIDAGMHPIGSAEAAKPMHQDREDGDRVPR
jgi:hypothetical protein